ncbi:hypothetical protein MGYG_02562 [Nannizzia gypsea CBS 118893]|uniref:Uncharacterized protein n=1 Tax=Arthroderma gypseum (strain ATCC MYA-4604 / CBS 118893) TaxID=535722 RepID=E4UN88_ARTGP|nr:hypothetical protein MGYG_02562 [Nannizzia gypsea CBS 118893]EFQ99549.1 hypothetical protein MGYG_02562 [Nannizzia gypsea CBS 118893]
MDSSMNAEERLSKVREGFPCTFGGFFKDERGSTKRMASFVTNSPPDIQRNARILAVCGISDGFDNLASPKKDGWFYSDFFAFHTLLHGQGASQKWCCSDQPSALLQKYGPYLHGNPYTQRRVVLNQYLLETELDDVCVIPSPSLLSGFLDILREESASALQLKQPLILFIFAHGDETTKSVTIGGEASSDEDMSYSNESEYDMSISTVASIVDPSVDLTIISTACFSGGWAVTSILDATVLSAAGVNRPSESWAKSSSLSRACGNIYASALIKALAMETSDEQQLASQPIPHDITTSSAQDETSTPDMQAKTFSEFARTVHKLLLTGIDRFGHHHDIRFSAQNDDWESHWRKRTGFPLADFQSKWDSLEMVEARPTTILNRDPLAEDTEIDNATLVDIRGQYGSSSSYMTGLRRLARKYLQSFPGRDSLAPNSSLHQQCADLLRRKEFSKGALSRIESALQYRMGISFLANQLVVGFSLPLPHGVFCEEWDEDTIFTYNSQERSRLFQRLLSLFPSPTRNQGVKGWVKGYWYIVAALIEADLSPSQMDHKIQQLFEGARGFAASTSSSPIKTKAFAQFMWRDSTPTIAVKERREVDEPTTS